MESLVASLPGVTDTVLPLLEFQDTCSASVDTVPMSPSLLVDLYDRKETLDLPNAPPAESARYSSQFFQGGELWDIIADNLSPTQFIIFQMYYIYNFTQQEIADIIGWGNSGNVSHTLGRCRKRLHKKLSLFANLL